MENVTFFPKEETECRCGCGGDITDSFRASLDIIRAEVGAPMRINSGFRCEAYDKSIGGKGVHPTGKAADVACSGLHAHKILTQALIIGMKGVGVSQRGSHEGRFLHLDMTDGKTRPWIWSY